VERRVRHFGREAWKLTVRAIAGLVLYNAILCAGGCGVLFALRGWRSWGELVRLSGLAYLLGVAAAGVIYTLELVSGIPFSLATILATAVCVLLGGILIGRLLGHTVPPLPRPARLPRITVVGALFAAASLVFLEALFRAGRLAGLSEYDAWAFWVPKAKAIYYFHGLDLGFWQVLPGQSYPPLVPALEASTFHFMGSPDVVTLHLQFWFLFAGFLAAVVGLLAPLVPRILLWPPALLALVTPEIVRRALQPQGDLLLDELFALGAVLLALWLTERRTWQLGAASLLLAGAMLTKREGFLLAACVIGAALAATVAGRRQAWPRLAAVGAVAVLLSIPWRVWFELRGLPSDAPEAGGTGLLKHLDRVWPSFDLTMRDLFSYHLWLVVAPLVVVAVVAALLAGRYALASYVAVLLGLAVVGFTWITWAFPTLPITEDPAVNPITRAVGSLVLVSCGLVPLLLAAAWRGPELERAVPA
jgi:hypothetical protein